MGGKRGYVWLIAILEREFPGLQGTPWQPASPAVPNYNCIAWAMSDTVHWWEPSNPDTFWPQGAPHARTIDAYVAAISLAGYVPCDGPALEHGFEKIALFVSQQGVPTHAARQLPSGSWTSKLGRFVDIEHELSALEGQQYGQVSVILKRRVSRPKTIKALVQSIMNWIYGKRGSR